MDFNAGNAERRLGIDTYRRNLIPKLGAKQRFESWPTVGRSVLC